VDQSSPNFLHPTREGLQLITCYTDFWYLNPLHRYWQSKSKIDHNHE